MLCSVHLPRFPSISAGSAVSTLAKRMSARPSSASRACVASSIPVAGGGSGPMTRIVFSFTYGLSAADAEAPALARAVAERTDVEHPTRRPYDGGRVGCSDEADRERLSETISLP